MRHFQGARRRVWREPGKGRREQGTLRSMAASESERKRREPEAAADEEDEEERWVGPLPGEAAQAKRRRGNGRSGAFACLPLLCGRYPGPGLERWVAARPQPPQQRGPQYEVGAPGSWAALGRFPVPQEPFACSSGSYVEWPGCGGTSWAQSCRSWAPYFCFVWEMPAGKEALLGSAGSAETVLPTNVERNGF